MFRLIARLARHVGRNMKQGLKSVFLNWREYLSFFGAVLILQTFFWMLTFSNTTNLVRGREQVEAEYTYHLAVENMNTAQEISLYNDTRQYRILNEGIELITYSEDGSAAWIVFEEDDKDTYADRFIAKYIDKLSEYGTSHSVTKTPLLTYDSEYVVNTNVTYWLIMILLAVIATFLLMSLYYIRVNNFRFQYGVYMTFGADFKKLLGSSIWEMVSMSLVMAIPSGLLSAWFTHMNYASVGVKACYGWDDILYVLIFNCVVVVAAVWWPMKATSRKTPMFLLSAADNSNYVSSPRTSSKILGVKAFHGRYELLGVWRFRKYYLKLLLIAVSFGALFICGLYVAQMNKTAETRDLNEYDIVYTDEITDPADVELAGEELIEALGEMEQVKYVSRAAQVSATQANSHILINKSNKYFSGNYVLKSDNLDGYTHALASLYYTASDMKFLQMLEQSGNYDIEGDLYSVLNREKTVAVSENIYNAKRVQFKVGDKIAIAKAVKMPGIPELGGVYSAKIIFQQRLEKWTYEYEEYTVGAVIKNAEAGDGIMVCMTDADYEYVTRKSPTRTRLDVYLEEGTHPDEVEGVFNEILDMLSIYDGWSASNNGAAFRNLQTAQKNNYNMILTIAMAILAISPVIWFFSQTLFWRKREEEMSLLRATGAVEQEIKRIHVVAGGIMAVLSFVLCLVMGYAANYLLYFVCNSVLPSLGFGDGIRYEYYLSFGALAFSALIAVVCGFFSSLLPYYSWWIREKKRIAREAEKQGKAEKKAKKKQKDQKEG